MKSYAPPPDVSILLPVYNAETTIKDCLKSIQRQTLTNWECIIVDDGSNDSTPNLIAHAVQNDKRFVYIPLKHNGIVSTLNNGIAYCDGSCIARMDSDDIMHRQRLAKQWNTLQQHPDLDIIGSHVHIFPRSTMGKGTKEYETWLNNITTPENLKREAFVECPIAHPTYFGKRECFQKFPYKNNGWPEDYDILLRWLAADKNIGILPYRLLSWRNHENKLSKTHPDYSMERFTACKAHYLANGFLKNKKTYTLSGYGKTGRTIAKALKKHGKTPKLIIDLNPKRIGQSIEGISVIHPNQIEPGTIPPILVSVAGIDRRTASRKLFQSIGLTEGKDFICVA